MSSIAGYKIKHDWLRLTYQQYLDIVKNVAKAFIKVGDAIEERDASLRK